MTVSLFTSQALAAAGIALFCLSCSKSPTATNSQASVGGLTAVDYSKRVGVAVRTPSRTCVTVNDGTLQSGSPVTLVIPSAPQRYVSAQVSKRSADACPITQEVSLAAISYELSVPPETDLPKLTPFVTVLGNPAASSFAMDNLNVQADIAQTDTTNTFRACGATDGVYLTIWRGVPINGTRLWTGHYYESGAPGGLPTCTPAETSIE
jgi:hypothetical protein